MAAQMTLPTRTIFCEKCHRVLNEKEFYSSNNIEKYPDGKIHICKKCITMHVDNWDSSTYMWIIQECDIPYMPDEWNKLLETYGKNKNEITGTTIIGRYIGKMRLRQFKDYRWQDTEFLQQLADHQVEEAMKRQGYAMSDIQKQIMSQRADVPTGDVEVPHFEIGEAGTQKPPRPEDQQTEPQEDYLAKQNGDIEADLAADLTDEDKKYLLIKWGRLYQPDEWVLLEQLYNDMMKSYDIQTAGDINTLKLACKASLKANQLMDLGDVDGAQKMAKIYDGMMKSGKWTAAQNKKEEDEAVDSIGEIVALCEKEGFIPRYYIDSPKDKVDRVIQDMQIFNRQLVTEELGLGNMIENSIKQIEQEKEKIAEAGKENVSKEEREETELFDYTKPVISEEDFTDFTEMEDQWKEEADRIMAEEVK